MWILVAILTGPTQSPWRDLVSKHMLESGPRMRLMIRVKIT